MEEHLKRLGEINRISDMLHSDDPEMQNLGLCLANQGKNIDFSLNREYMLSVTAMYLAMEAYELGKKAGIAIKNKANEERTKQCRSKKTTPLFYQQQHKIIEIWEETNSNRD